MCLATGAKRCGVYCGVTEWKCITLPVIFAVVLPLFTIWLFTFLSVRRVIDAHSDVSTHRSTCTSPSDFQTRPIGSTPISYCPHLNHIQVPEMQPIISPEIWKKLLISEKQTVELWRHLYSQSQSDSDTVGRSGRERRDTGGHVSWRNACQLWQRV